MLNEARKGRVGQQKNKSNSKGDFIQWSAVVAHDLSPYMAHAEVPTLSFGRSRTGFDV